jgi:hypothetical protein
MNTDKSQIPQSCQNAVSGSVTRNELRIGNILLNEKNELFELSGYLIWNFTTLQNQNVSTDKFFKSVKLTEDWLQRFGFVKNDFDSHYEKDEFYVEVWENDCVFRWNDFNIDTTVKTVHRLQNLYFALTGSELQVLY